MAQITIREKDLTGSPASSTFDVAVVPGLTTKTQAELEKLGVQYGTPIFVNSVADFQNLFGNTPVQLTGAGIPYDYTEGVGITTGVAEDVTCTDITVEQDASVSGLSFILSNDAGSGNVIIPDLEDKAFESFRTIDIATSLTAQSIIGVTLVGMYDSYTVDHISGGEPILAKITYGGQYEYDLATITLYPNPNCMIYTEGSTTPTPLTHFFSDENNQNDSLVYPVTLSNMVAAVAPSTDGYFFGATATENRNLDPGYIYACELLFAGIPIYYIPIEGTTALDVYEAMERQTHEDAETHEEVVDKWSIFDQLRDRGTYNVKYLTSGGYPTYEYNNNSIVDIMLEVAGANNDETDDYKDFDTYKITNGRGDCLALIDHFEIDDRNLLGEGSVYWRVNQSYDETEQPCGLKDHNFLSYGTIFTPYAQYNLQNTYGVVGGKKLVQEYLPASFAYMTCLAKQLNGSIPSYEATAGVGRGTVTNVVFSTRTNKYNLCTKEVLSNYIANYFNAPMEADGSEPISINALTQINPYGIVIWGDRTLLQKDKVLGIKATGIVSIRNMVSDIKKQMYQTARKYMFSANNDALWINFRNGVVGLLNQMKSGYGIKSYSLRKDTEKSTKNALYVLCSIQPVYPVEKFDITIEITDEVVEVAEEVTE